jgi:tape measure domain-containing protein
MTVAKELVVKFTEAGLAQVGSRADETLRKIGKRFDEIVRQSKAAFATIAENVSLGGVVEPDETAGKALARSAAKMAVAVNKSFKDLRVKSQQELRLMQEFAQSSFNAIRESGIASAQDVVRSQQALASRLRSIRLSSTGLDPGIEAAFKSLGITAQASIRAAKQALVADFAAIKQSGVASAQEIGESYRNLKARIAALDQKAVENAFSELGIKSAAGIEEAKRAAIASFARIKAELAGTVGGTKEVERAFKALKDTIRKLEGQINIRAPKIEKVDKVGDAFKLLGLPSKAEIDAKKRELVNAFAEIKNNISAQLGGRDETERVFRALKEQIRALNASIKLQAPDISPVQQAFANLNVKTRAEIEKLKRGLLDDFRLIKESGQHSAADIEAAYAALKQRLRAIDPTRVRAAPAAPTPAGPSPAEQSLGTLGIRSIAQLREEIQKTKAALATLRASGVGFDEIARASTAAARRIAALNREIAGIDTATRSTFRRITAYLASFAFEAAGAIFAVTAAGYAMAKPFIEIGKIQSKFENLNSTMLSLGDSAEQAQAATGFLKDIAFGGKTKFDLDAITNAFIKLKTGGIDPTQGTLLALLDTIAATGGTAAQLEGAARAINQIASKGKLASEELVGQLAEQLPGAVRLAAKSYGITYDNIRELLDKIKAGSIGARDFLTRLFTTMQQDFSGAGQRSLQNIDGIIVQFRQRWQRFLDDIGQSGAFDSLKAFLQDLLKQLDEAAANGSLQKLAKDISDALVVMLKALVAVIGFLREFGGLIVQLAGIAIVVRLVRTLAGWFGTLSAVLSKMRTVWAFATVGASGFTAVMVGLRAVMLTALGPVGWIAGIALAIYQLGRRANQTTEDIARLREIAQSDATESSDLKGIEERTNALRTKIEKLAKTVVVGRGGVIANPERIELQRQLDEAESQLAAAKKKLAQNKLQKDREDFAGEIEGTVTEGAFKGVPNVTGADKDKEEGEKRLARERDVFAARIALIKKLTDIELDETRRRLKAEEDELEHRQERGLIAIRAYYAERLRIVQQANDKEIEALKKERELILRETGVAAGDIDRLTALVRDEKPLTQITKVAETFTDKKGKVRTKLVDKEVPIVTAEQIRGLREAADIAAKIQALQEDTAEASRKAARDTADGYKDLFRSFNSLTAELADLQGKPATALEIQIDEQYKDQLQQIDSELDDLTRFNRFVRVNVGVEEKSLSEEEKKLIELQRQAQQAADALRKVKQKIEDIKAIRRVEVQIAVKSEEIDRALRNLDISKRVIEADVARGDRTPTEAKEQIEALEAETARRIQKRSDDLDAEIAKLKQLGKDTGDLEIKQRELKQILYELKNPVDEIKVAVNDVAREGFGQLFSDIIAGGQSASKAISNFAKSVLKSFLDIIAQKLGKRLFDSFGSGLGTLGSTIGGFLGLKTGGPVEKRAGGGPVEGPGTETSDSIPAVGPQGMPYRLSDGEYIINAKAVKHFGEDFFQRINKAKNGIVMPRALATGGPVSNKSGKPATRARREGPGNLMVQLHPDALNYTMRDWLEGEFARIAATR